MTAEEAARVMVIFFDAKQGKISDDGGRPWLFVDVATTEEAQELREAFGGRGFAKPRRDRHGGRYGAWGNDALELLEYLLGAGLNGGRGKMARSLLAHTATTAGREHRSSSDSARPLLTRPQRG